jgi:hypothetical protein
MGLWRMGLQSRYQINLPTTPCLANTSAAAGASSKRMAENNIPHCSFYGASLH